MYGIRVWLLSGPILGDFDMKFKGFLGFTEKLSSEYHFLHIECISEQ